MREHEAIFYPNKTDHPQKRLYVAMHAGLSFGAPGQLRGVESAERAAPRSATYERYYLAYSGGAGKGAVRTAGQHRHRPASEFLRDRCWLLPFGGGHAGWAKLPLYSRQFGIRRPNGGGTADS